MGEAFFAEDPFDQDADETWCVDHGTSMEVMSTESIRLALARGALRPSQKVWRDGHACWQSISDFAELMPRDLAHERTSQFEVPERSGPRLIQRTELGSGSAEPSRPVPVRHLRVGYKAKAFFSAVLAGILLGLVVFLPFASPEQDLADLGSHAWRILAP